MFERVCQHEDGTVTSIMGKMCHEHAQLLTPYVMMLLCLQTQDEFLESVLKDCDFTADDMFEVKNKNKMRDFIRTNFPQRSCHTLPIPSADQDTVRQLGSVPDSMINPAFVQVSLSIGLRGMAAPAATHLAQMRGRMFLQCSRKGLPIPQLEASSPSMQFMVPPAALHNAQRKSGLPVLSAWRHQHDVHQICRILSGIRDIHSKIQSVTQADQWHCCTHECTFTNGGNDPT
jgi:hypothetical protein